MDGENNYPTAEFREELRDAKREIKVARKAEDWHTVEFLAVHISILEGQIADRVSGRTSYNPDPEEG